MVVSLDESVRGVVISVFRRKLNIPTHFTIGAEEVLDVYVVKVIL